MSIGRTVFRGAGALAIVLVSFFGTLKILDLWDTASTEARIFKRWQGATVFGDGPNQVIKLRKDQSAAINFTMDDCRMRPVYSGKITAVRGPVLVGFRNERHDIWNTLLDPGYVGELPRPVSMNLCEYKANAFFLYAPKGDVEVRIEGFSGISLHDPVVK